MVAAISSNPCPFLLWIATSIFHHSRRTRSDGSNPCPFLLWIATSIFHHSRRTRSDGSNPCPFLLWIATIGQLQIRFRSTVVTLVHFYCGLRLEKINCLKKWFVVHLCPFLLWIATRHPASSLTVASCAPLSIFIVDWNAISWGVRLPL